MFMPNYLYLPQGNCGNSGHFRATLASVSKQVYGTLFVMYFLVIRFNRISTDFHKKDVALRRAWKTRPRSILNYYKLDHWIMQFESFDWLSHHGL